MQASMLTTCEGGLGAARVFTTDTVTANKPEATAAFASTLKINPNFFHRIPKTYSSHVKLT